jgi:hypothetical protein
MVNTDNTDLANGPSVRRQHSIFRRSRRSSLLASIGVGLSLVVALTFLTGNNQGAAQVSTPTLSQGLAAAVGQLRGSSNVQFSSEPSPSFGAIEGTDSSGGFSLTYQEVSSAQGSLITGVITSDSALQNAFAGAGSVQGTEFNLDATSLAILSSRPVSPGIINRRSATDATPSQGT